MVRVATRKIGLGAVVVLVCLALTNLAGGEECEQSNLPQDWSYPPDWCCAFGVTADQATVDPGATATFTINSACPGAACTGVESNTGASGFACSVNPEGTTVTVGVPAAACGSFRVTVPNSATPGCPERTASSDWVRINNTGQGGVWAQVSSSCSWECRTCEEFSFPGCEPGPLDYHDVEYWNEFYPCSPASGNAGRYKIADVYDHTAPWWDQCCTNVSLYACIVGSGRPPCHNPDPCPRGVGGYYRSYRSRYGIYEWRCY